MLIGANLSTIAPEVIWINMLKTENFSTEKQEILNVCYATGFLLFNVSHWMFAHKYFSMSRQLPLKLAGAKVPRFVIICDQITNWIFLSLNSIPPIFFGVAAIGVLQASSNGKMKLAG